MERTAEREGRSKRHEGALNGRCAGATCQLKAKNTQRPKALKAGNGERRGGGAAMQRDAGQAKPTSQAGRPNAHEHHLRLPALVRSF